MSDLRRSMGEPASYADNRYSCNSTPEPIALNKLSNGFYQRNPLLQALADHSNMGSLSGGSTTSGSTSTTATATTIGRGNCNGDTQFEEREIFYLSPSKRKSSNCNTPNASQLRSSLKATDRLHSYSPSLHHNAASIAPTYPALTTPSAAYGFRAAGNNQDLSLSFDSYDASSHYSDTAMQILRSGGNFQYNNNNMNASAAVNNNNCHSSNSSLAQQHLAPSQRSQNNVTFSNYVTEQRVMTPSSHRGSLRRSKGRSNQSLCSCDAGAETEINPDPSRPLYQYSLERRRKTHTYTCEQNAQILMRLERERNHRRLSLSGSRDDLQVRRNFQII